MRKSNVTLDRMHLQLEKVETARVHRPRASVGKSPTVASQPNYNTPQLKASATKEPEQARIVQKAYSSTVDNTEKEPQDLLRPSGTEDPGGLSAESSEFPSRQCTARLSVELPLKTRRISLGTADTARLKGSAPTSASKASHQANVRVVARIRPPNKLETVLSAATIL